MVLAKKWNARYNNVLIKNVESKVKNYFETEKSATGMTYSIYQYHLVVWRVVLYEYFFVGLRWAVGDYHDRSVTLRTTIAEIRLHTQ